MAAPTTDNLARTPDADVLLALGADRRRDPHRHLHPVTDERVGLRPGCCRLGGTGGDESASATTKNAAKTRLIVLPSLLVRADPPDSHEDWNLTVRALMCRHQSRSAISAIRTQCFWRL